MKPVQPIFTLKEIAQVDQELLKLLRILGPEDWEKQTVAPLWKVKDVAAHLLDGAVRGIALSRDQFFGDPPPEINAYRDLIDYLDRLNADWVKAMRRISPLMLISFIEIANRAYLEHLKTLDPFGEAIFSVSWAGEESSANWFHIAREYTEKWHHQQQIRLAVGRAALLLQEEFYGPLMDTFMRALPYHYRQINAIDGTVIRFSVEGLSQTWYLWQSAGKWNLLNQCDFQPTSTVILDKGVAWRIFTKGISRTKAEKHIQIEGDQSLGVKVLEMVLIMG